jgi:hypothetical protein
MDGWLDGCKNKISFIFYDETAQKIYIHSHKKVSEKFAK